MNGRGTETAGSMAVAQTSWGQARMEEDSVGGHCPTKAVALCLLIMRD